MTTNTFFYYNHSLRYAVRAVVKKRRFRKTIKGLHIGCQYYSEETVCQLACSSDSIKSIDMGKAGVLTGDDLWRIYEWFNRL